MSITAMKQALEALDAITDDVDGTGLNTNMSFDKSLEAITSLRQAIEQAEKQEPMVYDKTEMNCFVQELYDRKMQEGKRGHYETMFHCVHQAIKRLYTTPQPKHEWVGLTDEEIEQKSSKKCSCFAYSASECICGAWNQQPIAHRFVDVECPLCGEMAVAHTHPVLNKREWAGLTQEDIDIAFDDTQEGGGFNEFARAIEQILRSKNT